MATETHDDRCATCGWLYPEEVYHAVNLQQINVTKNSRIDITTSVKCPGCGALIILPIDYQMEGMLKI